MFLNIFLVFSLLFAILVLFVISSAFFGFLITRVPFVPTSADDIKFIVQKLGVTSSDVFYDLGSGNGKVCFLVNELTGAKCVGYELTWWTHLLAKAKSKFILRRQGYGGQENQNAKLQFYRQNFFKVNWAEADIIYGYLYPPLMKRVEEKFRTEMRPGSMAIIRDFPFPNLKPEQVFRQPKSHEIYVYRV